MLSPIMWVCHTLFFLGLPFGRVDRLGRAECATTTRLPGRRRSRQLWPQTLLGVAGLAVVALTHPAALP